MHPTSYGLPTYPCASLDSHVPVPTPGCRTTPWRLAEKTIGFAQFRSAIRVDRAADYHSSAGAERIHHVPGFRSCSDMPRICGEAGSFRPLVCSRIIITDKTSQEKRSAVQCSA